MVSMEELFSLMKDKGASDLITLILITECRLRVKLSRHTPI